jgi:hypothetical protein
MLTDPDASAMSFASTGTRWAASRARSGRSGVRRTNRACKSIECGFHDVGGRSQRSGWPTSLPVRRPGLRGHAAKALRTSPYTRTGTKQSSRLLGIHADPKRMAAQRIARHEHSANACGHERAVGPREPAGDGSSPNGTAFARELMALHERRATRQLGLRSMSEAFTGTVSFVQRFASALRLNDQS